MMFTSRARMIVFAGLTTAAMALAGFTMTAKTTAVEIEAVSNRADLISGGDVLLRVTLPGSPAASDATLSVGGAAVPGALKPAPDGKGQLKALNRRDYPNVTFTDEQWANMVKTFKTGVCDYSKPPVDYARTTPWLTYSGDGKYRPLGPAPRSTGE